MELVTLLTTANEAGFQTGSLLGLAVIYWRLSKQNNKHWEELIKTLKGHDDKNEQRFTNIESHIGLKKKE